MYRVALESLNTELGMLYNDRRVDRNCWKRACVGTNLAKKICSMARTVSVIGGRWTLLILWDCFLRVRRFEDFQERLGVTRPILASRLKKLVDEFFAHQSALPAAADALYCRIAVSAPNCVTWYVDFT